VSKWKCHSGEERIGYEKDEVQVLRQNKIKIDALRLG